MALFGLTAVDMTANNNPAGAATAAVASSSSPPSSAGGNGNGGGSRAGSGSPSPAPDAPAPSSNPDLPHNGTYLTEVPLPASSAAPAPAPAPAPAAPNRPAKVLAPMAAPPSPPPPAASTSTRALAALTTSPSAASNRRLPPIGGGSGSAIAPGAPGSPERDRVVQALSTPQSRMVTPREQVPGAGAAPVNPGDQRVFDGKDLEELVRVSTEDYSDVARLQNMITMALAGRTAEAGKAQALMQIREASIHNPMFSLTPTMVDLVKEHLLSRNRMLRPAAAYALAGYAANSRHGRGLMAGVNASELLPRLNAMMRCKVDSMDARYSALAVLTASMHNDHKEMVGRSGSIPLLIALIRQNIGSVPSAGRLTSNDTVSLEYVIGLYGSERSSERSSVDGSRPETTPETKTHPPHGHLHAHPHGHAHPGSPGHLPLPPHHQHGGGCGSPGGGHVQAWGSESGGFVDGLPPGGIPRVTATEGGGAAGGRGLYVLTPKPAAAHAAAALVNLAELPANRQRMRDAGIASLLEDVLLSRNDNVIKDRCRLIVDCLQMDTNRFHRAQTIAEVNNVTAVSQAFVNFANRGKQARAEAAAAAAAAASERPRPVLHSTHGGFNPLGQSTLKGSLAWNLARQLERGDDEDDRRVRTMRERNARVVSRVQSQASTRVVGHGTGGGGAGGGQKKGGGGLNMVSEPGGLGTAGTEAGGVTSLRSSGGGTSVGVAAGGASGIGVAA